MGILFTVGGFALLSLGLPAIGIVAYVSLARRGDLATAALEGTTRVLCAEAPTGRVRIRGDVVATEGGTVSEPISGSAAVWYRIEAFCAAAYGSQRSFKWAAPVPIREARDFGVDDGSGQVVRVIADDARYVTPMDVFGGAQVAAAPDGLPWTRHELTDGVESFLRSQLPGSEGTPVKAHRWAIVPAANVTVVGYLDRSTGEPVLRDRSPDCPLVVYGVDQSVVLEDRRVRRRNRVLVAAAGVAMSGMGVVMLAIGWFF